MLEPSNALEIDYYCCYFLLLLELAKSIFVGLACIIFLAISSKEREFSKFWGS